MRITLIAISATLAILALVGSIAHVPEQRPTTFNEVGIGSEVVAKRYDPNAYRGRTVCVDGWEVKILRHKLGAVYAKDEHFRPIPCAE